MMTQLPQNMDEVLAELDRIIDISLRENSMLGVFAYVYRRTTAQIKNEIELRRFEDNERMARFDVAFANYYIRAWHQYRNRQPLSAAWKTSFDAQHDKLTAIQHLLMGMNAHISLDLGVAAAEFMKGEPIETMENDFRKVNQILGDLTNEMQQRLGKISLSMFMLDWIGENTDERIANFGIREAREQSWRNANLLWALDGEMRQAAINEIDTIVASMSSRIRSPQTRLLRYTLNAIRFFEEKQVARLINGLRE